MREHMSSSERRLADFILENTHLLRDYSSQQLAGAVGVSQSSVVKFSQKLGFRGYPHLKLAVNEAVALGQNNESADTSADAQSLSYVDTIRSEANKHLDYLAEIEVSDGFAQALRLLKQARWVQILGEGDGQYPAVRLAQGLCYQGLRANLCGDHRLDLMLADQFEPQDLLIVVSPMECSDHCQQMIATVRQHQGKVLGLCRFGDTQLTSVCDVSLPLLVDMQSAPWEHGICALSLSYLVDILLLALKEG
ncbi:HTH-type transcriptional regulator HexR [Saliniradius amylolyticus]|uniref:HTH-type transcriptional regulator HexR n=2 Tax=Saliniradius amylolyticus TaxID=2183582 RepID=A0A2S2E5A1_9ALTE|nr:HTH-type transcriptional regulator HexR [Saliniradius amylolyticus]